MLISITTGFTLILLVLGFTFIFLAPFIFLTIRFYKTTATREAYLTFTIPTSTSSIILSKFIVYFVWVLVTFMAAYLSFFIIDTIGYSGSDGPFHEVINGMVKSLFEQPVRDIIVQIAALVLGLISTILSFFMAISLGQLVRNHRLLASCGFYLVAYTIMQVINLIATLPLLKDMMTMSSEEAELEITLAQIDSINLQAQITSIILTSIYIVLFYIITHCMLEKKLNLL